MAIKSVNFNIRASLQGSKRKVVDPVADARKAKNQVKKNSTQSRQSRQLTSRGRRRVSTPAVTGNSATTQSRNNTPPRGQSSSLTDKTARVKNQEKQKRKFSTQESVKRITSSGKRSQSVIRSSKKDIKKISSDKKITYQDNEISVGLEKLKR